MSSAASSAASSATKRLIRELDVWRTEQETEKGIERLGPVSEDNLLEWQAVINGHGIGGGYDCASPSLSPPPSSSPKLTRRASPKPAAGS